MWNKTQLIADHKLCSGLSNFNLKQQNSSYFNNFWDRHPCTGHCIFHKIVWKSKTFRKSRKNIKFLGSCQWDEGFLGRSVVFCFTPKGARKSSKTAKMSTISRKFHCFLNENHETCTGKSWTSQNSKSLKFDPIDYQLWNEWFYVIWTPISFIFMVVFARNEVQIRIFMCVQKLTNTPALYFCSKR